MVLAVVALVAGACSDDDNNIATDDETTPSSTTAISTSTTPSTSQPPAPTFEFAIQLDNLFDPTPDVLEPQDLFATVQCIGDDSAALGFAALKVTAA